MAWSSDLNNRIRSDGKQKQKLLVCWGKSDLTCFVLFCFGVVVVFFIICLLLFFFAFVVCFLFVCVVFC